MKTNCFRYVYSLPLLLFAATLYAETAYVNDRLFLGVYAQPSTEQSAIHTLTSGTVIEVLERQETFTKIQTPDGIEGWVRTRFISNDKPASVRIQEMETETQRLQQRLKNAPTLQEVNALKSQLDKAQSTIAALQNNVKDANSNQLQADDLQQQLAAAQNQALQLEQELQALKAQQTVQSEIEKTANAGPSFEWQYWYWYIGMALVFLLLGLLLGATLLAQRVRRRFNGIKVW